MKILFISMPSIHAERWIKNLESSEHELYWYDILGKGKIEVSERVNQLLNRRKRKIPYIKGEYYLSTKFPNLYQRIRPLLEMTENEALKIIIEEIKPQIIHSFEMQSCSYPILQTMRIFPNIKWIYSCWGSDLFYYKDKIEHNSKIKNVLQRVDYLQADCNRDLVLAEELGYFGENLPIIPGGTGYDIGELRVFKEAVEHRKIILIKGYEHKFGRALNVIKAIEKRLEFIEDYELIVFGAHPVVLSYIDKKKLPFRVYDRHQLNHDELLQLMGQALIYIGNSITDGMPNTLLEAIVMGAFPIQSNPGNVSAEIISNKINGLLINNPEDIGEIWSLINGAISNRQMIEDAYVLNQSIAIERLDLDLNKVKVLEIYKQIEKDILCE